MEQPLNIRTIASRGYVVQSHTIPAGFAAFLERKGLAGMTARTADGLYLEPRVPLARIFHAFEQAGAKVEGVRRAGQASDWYDRARPAACSLRRLTNPLAAEWLPTMPVA